MPCSATQVAIRKRLRSCSFWPMIPLGTSDLGWIPARALTCLRTTWRRSSSIVSTFLITFLYVRFADRKLDPLAAQLRDDIETGRRTEGEVK